MLDVGTRVRINENYPVRVDHGKTGTVTGHTGDYHQVDLDYGNDLPDQATLLFLKELDVLASV